MNLDPLSAIPLGVIAGVIFTLIMTRRKRQIGNNTLAISNVRLRDQLDTAMNKLARSDLEEVQMVALVWAIRTAGSAEEWRKLYFATLGTRLACVADLVIPRWNQAWSTEMKELLEKPTDVEDMLELCSLSYDKNPELGIYLERMLQGQGVTLLSEYDLRDIAGHAARFPEIRILAVTLLADRAIAPDEIKELLNDYVNMHPIKAGFSEEQRFQLTGVLYNRLIILENNIENLKEIISRCPHDGPAWRQANKKIRELDAELTPSP